MGTHPDDEPRPEPRPAPDDTDLIAEHWADIERQALDAFAAIDALDPIIEQLGEGTFAEIAVLYDRLDQIQPTLKFLRESLEAGLAQQREGRETVVENVGRFEITRKWSQSWATEDVRTEMRKYVVGQIVDEETGEVDPAQLAAVDAALTAVKEVYSLSSPKMGGMNLMGLDADEYRTRKQNGWKINFTRTMPADAVF